MPDIFLQRQHKELIGNDKYVYKNYYEIYIQKLIEVNGVMKQKFCLKDTNMKLVEWISTPDKNANIPLVEFVDIDRDGMMDMVFYHNKKIYVYYNKHSH